MGTAPLEINLEPSKRPRDEYIWARWRIQIDLHPDGTHWNWMIEEENNGPVYWHNTNDRPSYAEVQKYINSQPWG